MKALAAVLLTLLMASGAVAQGYSITAPVERDALEIREASSKGHAAEVYYRNSKAQTSQPGQHHLQLGDVLVDVEITITGGPEIIRVVPRGPGLVAIPSEANVEDGSDIVILISVPMY